MNGSEMGTIPEEIEFFGDYCIARYLHQIQSGTGDDIAGRQEGRNPLSDPTGGIPRVPVEEFAPTAVVAPLDLRGKCGIIFPHFLYHTQPYILKGFVEFFLDECG